MALLAFLQTIRHGTARYLTELEDGIKDDPRFIGCYRIFRPDLPPDDAGDAFFDLVMLYELNDALDANTAAQLPHSWRLVLVPESILDICGIDPAKVADYSACVVLGGNNDLPDKKEPKATDAVAVQPVVESRPPGDPESTVGLSQVQGLDSEVK